MRLKPALIMLGVFLVVTAALTVFVVTYQEPAADVLAFAEARPLFPGLSAADIRKVEITSPALGKEPVVIELHRDRQVWQMTRPVRETVPQKVAAKLVKSLVRLRALAGYPARSFVEYELDPPRSRITVTTRSGDVHSVAFGTRVVEVARASTQEYADLYSLRKRGGAETAAPRRYARVGDRRQVVVVEDDIHPRIDVGLARFREPRLLFAEAEGGIGPVKLAGVRAVSVTVREDQKDRTLSLVQSAPGAWRLKTPFEARANETARRALARTLRLRAAEDGDAFVDRPGDLARYGLAPPSVVVRFEMRPAPGGRARVHTVSFGTCPTGQENLIYARSSARPGVLLVDADVVRNELRRAPGEFRERSLVEFAERDVESMTLTYPRRPERPPITVRRRSRGSPKWSITAPVTGRASGARVLALVRRAVRLQAQVFVTDRPGDLKEYGLSAPQVVAAVALKDGRTARLLIGGRSAKKGEQHLVYARNAGAAEPWVVLVDKGIVGDLSPAPESLRSRVLLEDYTPHDEKVELTIARGAGKVVLRKKGQDWSFVEPRGEPVETGAPDEFLAVLGGRPIQKWPDDRPTDDAKYGLKKPYARITLKMEPGQSAYLKVAGAERPRPRSYVVHLGKADGRCYARLPSETNVYEVTPEISRAVDKGSLAFRDRQVLNVREDAVIKIEIVGKRTTYHLRRARGAWALEQPPISTGNASNVKELLTALCTLRAKELIRKGGVDRPTYKLDRAQFKPHRMAVLSIGAEQPPGQKDKPRTVKETKTLIVGAAVSPGAEGGDRYAVVAEDGVVFVMAAEQIALFDQEFAPRVIYKEPVSHVRELSVELGREWKFTVARRQKNAPWELTSHHGVPDPGKIRALLKAACDIEAERYAAYDRDNLAKYGLEKPRLIVTIHRWERADRTLSIGDPADKEKKTYYATGAGVPAVYLVSERTFNALNKTANDVMKRD